MLIDKIIYDDTQCCYPAMVQDRELQKLENKFYELTAQMPEMDRFEMEELFSKYTARVTRIAYLKGMKDFAELHITLKDDVDEIPKEVDGKR